MFTLRQSTSVAMLRKDTAGKPTLLRSDEVRGALYALETSGLPLSIFNNWQRSMAGGASRTNTRTRRHHCGSSAKEGIDGAPDLPK